MTKLSFRSVIVITLILQLLTISTAFVSPKQPFSITTNSNRGESLLTRHAFLPSPASIFIEPSLLISTNENKDVAFEDAFSDNVDVFGDSTIQLIFIGFGVLVTLALVAKFFLNQMDSAIEKVLVDFETTMRNKYASRWVSIEAKLDGLDEPERSQKLFQLMENLQQTEPFFMDEVNKEMMSLSDS